MVDLLDMDRLKRSGPTEQRLASLEEQVGQVGHLERVGEEAAGSEEEAPPASLGETPP